MRAIWALTMAAMAIALPQVVTAQATGDFRLPPAGTPTPRIQGPTDSEHPVLRPVTPVRTATPTPSPTPSATASAPAPAPSRTIPAPVASRPPVVSPSPAPTARANRTPAPTPSETPSATPAAEATTSSPSPTPVPVAAASTAAPIPAPQATGQSMPLSWPWLLAIVAAVLALGGWWLHGRPAKVAEDDWSEADWLVANEPSPDAGVAPEPESAPKAAPATAPTPSPLPPVETPVRPAFGRETLSLSLETVRMSATLTSTSLSYRLTVTNKGSQVLGPVVIAGSMVSAHASLPTEAQLATDGQLLEVLHEIATLAPGESAVVAGDLRLPLPEITPIKSGESLLFVPLARFRAEAAETSAIAAFAIGETSAASTGGLLPLRIDMGPRIWNNISRRQIEMAVA